MAWTTWGLARQIAFNFGVWANIVVRARGTPTIPPATLEDGCIITAITATQYQLGGIRVDAQPCELDNAGSCSNAALCSFSAC